MPLKLKPQNSRKMNRVRRQMNPPSGGGNDDKTAEYLLVDTDEENQISKTEKVDKTDKTDKTDKVEDVSATASTIATASSSTNKNPRRITPTLVKKTKTEESDDDEDELENIVVQHKSRNKPHCRKEPSSSEDDSDSDSESESEMVTQTDTTESSWSVYSDEESEEKPKKKWKKTAKTGKTRKTDKTDKTDKTAKTAKTEKSGKTDKTGKTGKTGKTDKTDKTGKTGKTDKSRKKYVSESESSSEEESEEEEDETEEEEEDEESEPRRPQRKAAKKAMKKIKKIQKSKKELDFENMIENLIQKYTRPPRDEDDETGSESETLTSSSESEDDRKHRKSRHQSRKHRHSKRNHRRSSKKYDTESESESETEESESDSEEDAIEQIRFIIRGSGKKHRNHFDEDDDDDDDDDDDEEEDDGGGFMSMFGGKPKNPYDLKLPISKMTPELVEYLKKMPNILGSVPKPGDDIKQFRKMDSKEQKTIVESLKQMHDHYRTDEHPYFRILRLPIDAESKRNALEKQMQIMKSEQMGYEDSTNNKLQSWLHSFLKIPFGIYTKFPKTATRHPAKYLLKASQTLDKEVYGMDDAKDHLLRYVAQLITNPTAAGNCLAMLGPPGTGKTSLIKEALGKILNRPVHMIALGGNTDAAVLEGHSYTYEGSVCGQVADILIRSHCMNPVIIFDELDKVSSTQKGDEIIGLLTHITDSTQNTGFQDKYFAGINIDLSRVLFVFTMNDRSVVNKVLLDRLRVITTKGYSSREKRIIGDEYLLPKIMKEYGFDSLKISDDAWKYIMNGRSEPGVRNVKRDLETIISRLNIYRLCMKDKSFVVPTASEASASASASNSKGKEKEREKEKESTRLKGIPTNISWKDGDSLGEEDVKILLGNRDEGIDKPPPGMYA